MRKVAFHTLGCKVNQYETEAMEELFEKANYNIVSFTEVADIYIVNTCTVTNIADKKSRQMLSKAKKMNEDAIIVAVGCYAQIAEKKLKENNNIDIIIGNTKKNEVVSIVENYINDNTLKNEIIDISSSIEYEELWISKINEKTRVYIKIQDGCNRFCSYCIIPYTRGRVRSRLKESIIKEVQNVVNNGYKEIVLTGIHLASYKAPNYTLIDLIEELNKINGLERIRLGSLEPNIITNEFVNRLKNTEKICPHFHLSLQSGSDSILNRMNRKYNTSEFFDKVTILRNGFCNPSITTDVIVGFPGETDEEFIETMEFIRKVAFSDIHIFKYSKREGTKAASMKSQINSKIKNERSKLLEEVNKTNKTEYMNIFINKEVEILFEEVITIQDREYYLGHAKNYLKIVVPKSEEDYINKILNVKINKILNEYLIGSIV